VNAFNSALDVDYRFLEAFSALENLLSAKGAWMVLEDNSARMIQRLPKTEDTHQARLTLWRALGACHRQACGQAANEFMAYKVDGAAMQDEASDRETYAQLATSQQGQEEEALLAWRRSLNGTSQPGPTNQHMLVLSAQKKDYDGAWLAAQVAHGLLGDSGEGTKEILAKLGPYAKQREAFTQVISE